MKIERVDTLILDEFPNLLWVRPPSGRGLGTRLKPGTFERPDANVQTSSL
ncbi:MAG: hypothetical protein P1U37_03785 [Minwuia sp.]|nr:hypothetical protein [Minwuia sp.]